MDEFSIEPPVDDPEQLLLRPRSRFSTLRFVLQSKAAALSLVIIVAFIALAIFAPLVAPQDPWKLGFKRNLPPVWVQNTARPGMAQYLLGTDTLGRDIASRLIYGARTALVVALLAAPLAAIFGTLIGLVAGFAGRPHRRAVDARHRHLQRVSGHSLFHRRGVDSARSADQPRDQRHAGAGHRLRAHRLGQPGAHHSRRGAGREAGTVCGSRAPVWDCRSAAFYSGTFCPTAWRWSLSG